MQPASGQQAFLVLTCWAVLTLQPGLELLLLPQLPQRLLLLLLLPLLLLLLPLLWHWH
jgi:hypothetical protein